MPVGWWRLPASSRSYCCSRWTLFARTGNPYMGILAYVIAPGFLFLGMGMMALGAWFQRRQERRLGHRRPFAPEPVVVDLTRPSDRKKLRIFVVAAVVFLLFTAIGSYQTYHVSESVQFCGQACHVPMKPEFTAYQFSSHARVSCVECHVGHGPEAFVKAKMNGRSSTRRRDDRRLSDGPFRRPSVICAPRAKPVSNVTGHKNSSATLTALTRISSPMKRTALMPSGSR